jgi:hypothetical protein
MEMPSMNSTNPMAQKWEFVNFDKPVKEQDAAFRRRVRVGAMRAFRRRVEVFQTTNISAKTFVSLPATISEF